MWASSPYKIRLLISTFFDDPFAWVIFDVFPNLVIILLIADHMVIIPGLPDILAVFLVAKPFECRYEL